MIMCICNTCTCVLGTSLASTSLPGTLQTTSTLSNSSAKTRTTKWWHLVCILTVSRRYNLVAPRDPDKLQEHQDWVQAGRGVWWVHGGREAVQDCRQPGRQQAGQAADPWRQHRLPHHQGGERVVRGRQGDDSPPHHPGQAGDRLQEILQESGANRGWGDDTGGGSVTNWRHYFLFSNFFSTSFLFCLSSLFCALSNKFFSFILIEINSFNFLQESRVLSQVR